MDTTLPRAATPLRKGALLRLQHARGRAVAVFSGCLWVTQEGDVKDTIVGAGEELTIRKSGRTVITALEASCLTLVEPETDAETSLSDRRQTWRASRGTRGAPT